MFIALYHWKIKDGQEERFREGWHRRTEEIYRKCGSFGSRLHRAEDGTFVAYAQWEKRKDWEKMQQSTALEDKEAREMMLDSIEISFPDVYMNIVDDLLKTEKFANEA
jgi:heme-degrading monooxygenase HmoA